jgi:hypothetical protein
MIIIIIIAIVIILLIIMIIIIIIIAIIIIIMIIIIIVIVIMTIIIIITIIIIVTVVDELGWGHKLRHELFKLLLPVFILNVILAEVLQERMMMMMMEGDEDEKIQNESALEESPRMTVFLAFCRRVGRGATSARLA